MCFKFQLDIDYIGIVLVRALLVHTEAYLQYTFVAFIPRHSRLCSIALSFCSL